MNFLTIKKCLTYYHMMTFLKIVLRLMVSLMMTLTAVIMMMTQRNDGAKTEACRSGAAVDGLLGGKSIVLAE